MSQYSASLYDSIKNSSHCHSVVGRNVIFLTCRYASWLDQLVSGQLLLHNAGFMAHHLSTGDKIIC